MVEFCWKWPSVSGQQLCLTLAALVSNKWKFFAWLAYGIWLNQKGETAMKKSWWTEGAVKFSVLAATGVLKPVCLLPICVVSVPLKTAPTLQDCCPVQVPSQCVIHRFTPMSQAFLCSVLLGSNTLQTGLQRCKGQSGGRGTTPLPFGQRCFLWDGCCCCD